jgi:hypothetical protein
MARKLRARERVPVLGSDGRTDLGSCEVRKFTRAKGNPLKEILVSDPQGRPVASISVFRLHSRVRCGELEAEAAPVDSKQAAAVARAALAAAGGGPAAVIGAVIAEAECPDKD